MARRLTLIKASTKETVTVDDLVSGHSDEEIERPTSRKRPKLVNHTGGPKKYLRGRRGALRDLVEMPLDILFEIFDYLDIRDILHLSKTSKALQDTLTQKSASLVWKNARDKIKLPDCHPDLTEPQYARLMFDTLCHHCMKHNTQILFWSNLCRICKRCLNINAKSIDRDPSVPHAVKRIIPFVFIDAGRPIYKTADSIKRELVEEYESLGHATRTDWVASKTKQYKSREKYGKLCKAWIEEHSKLRVVEQEAIYQKRYMAIKAKLVEIGWDKEIEMLPGDELRSHRCVKQPKDLTDRIWNNIRPILIDMLENRKTERLRDDFRHAQKRRRLIFKDAYIRYMALQPIHTVAPPMVDTALMSPFETIIESPAEGKVTTEHFNDVFEKDFPTLSADWRASKDALIFALMKRYIPDAKKEDLLSPATLFTCTRCYAHLEYPRVLVHHCLVLRAREHEESDVIVDLNQGSWDPGPLMIQASICGNARTILETSGLDANTIAAQRGLAPTIFFECTSPKYTNKLMSWACAVGHLEYCKAPICLASISDEQRNSAMNYFNTAEKKKEDSDWYMYEIGRRWICVTCKGNKPRFWSELVAHFHLRHPKTEPLVCEEDYVACLDADLWADKNPFTMERNGSN